MICKDSEVNHPGYTRAVQADIDAVKSGEYNFKGVGYEGQEENEPR
jgi:hypothetical protein